MPGTRGEWRHVDSWVGVFSLVAALLGGVMGGVNGERWHGRLATRAAATDAVVSGPADTTVVREEPVAVEQS